MTDDTTEPLHVQALRRFANGRPMTDREQDIFNAGWQARGEQVMAAESTITTISGTPAEIEDALDALPVGTVLRYTEADEDWDDLPHEVVVKGGQGDPRRWRSSIWRTHRSTHSIACDEVPLLVLWEAGR